MYVKVIVTPSSKKESCEKKSEDTFKICVKEPAQRNLANKRIMEIVANELIVEVKKVKIISGHHSRKKILSVDKD